MTTLQALYLDLLPLVQRLDLSYECIRYYAYSVIKAQIAQISRRTDEDRFLHLIAFIVYQTFKLNDTLVDTLLAQAHKPRSTARRRTKRRSISRNANSATNPSVLWPIGCARMWEACSPRSGISWRMQN